MKYNIFFLILFIFSFLLSVPFYAEIADPFWWAYDYETYEENIDSFPLPENFVYYEDVLFLGDFYSFCGVGTKHYYYTMVASEMKFVFMVNSLYNARKDPENFPKTDISYAEMEDLRFLKNAPGCVSIREFQFLYGNDGELGTIWWKDSYGTKVLVFDQGVPEGEFWDQLMNPESVEIALEQLFRATNTELPDSDTSTDTATTDAIPSDGENASFPWLWLALPVAAVVIAGGAAFVLLRKKKRRV